MKRILVYGTANVYGGIELFFLTIINNNNPSKIQFDFVVSSDTSCPYKDEIIKNNGTVYAITSWGKSPKKHKKEFQSILDQHNYDYVWANATSASNSSIYPIVHKKKHTKLIVHSHGSAFETRNSGLKYQLLKIMHYANLKKLNQLANIKIACSQQAAEWLFDTKSIENDNVNILLNPINVENFLFDLKKRNEIRRQLGIRNEFVLVAAGRLEEVKNYPYLMSVFSKLLTKRPDSQLLILGEGSQRETLESLTTELGIKDHVKFLGFQKDLTPYLFAADALLLTSFSEGLPLITLEAQATGLSCFVSDRVTSEIKTTDLVEFLSIENEGNKWVESILSERQNLKERIVYNQEVAHSEFDIKQAMKKIEDIIL